MSSDDSEQLQILADLRRDGQAGLAAHFENLRARLARIATFRLDRRLGGRVSESDVVQEAYVRAARRLDHYLTQPDPYC